MASFSDWLRLGQALVFRQPGTRRRVDSDRSRRCWPEILSPARRTGNRVSELSLCSAARKNRHLTLSSIHVCCVKGSLPRRRYRATPLLIVSPLERPAVHVGRG